MAEPETGMDSPVAALLQGRGEMLMFGPARRGRIIVPMNDSQQTARNQNSPRFGEQESGLLQHAGC